MTAKDNFWRKDNVKEIAKQKSILTLNDGPNIRILLPKYTILSPFIGRERKWNCSFFRNPYPAHTLTFIPLSPPACEGYPWALNFHQKEKVKPIELDRNCAFDREMRPGCMRERERKRERGGWGLTASNSRRVFERSVSNFLPVTREYFSLLLRSLWLYGESNTSTKMLYKRKISQCLTPTLVYRLKLFRIVTEKLIGYVLKKPFSFLVTYPGCHDQLILIILGKYVYQYSVYKFNIF